MKKALIISILFLAGLSVTAAFPQRESIPAAENNSVLHVAADSSESPTQAADCIIAAKTRFEAEITATPAVSENITEPPRDNAPPETDPIKTHDVWRDFEGTSAGESGAETMEKTEPTIAPAQTEAPSASDDLYRTDVYPENVYSEEFIYDADGNLIGKTTTIPTAFGPDTIWIDDHAYYDVPGFGLIEWGGPNQRTEDYTMYENGNKVGIMGGEDEVPTRASSQPEPQDWPEPDGEVTDQTIHTVPKRSNTPPDYKPDTTPPCDPNARNIG